ncbi:MAG TPA: TIGR01777 family oxidoreductase [Chthoniobacterales bacterium]
MVIGITGVTGFIGKNLAAAARRRGHSVIGFSRTAQKTLPDCNETRIFSGDIPLDLTHLNAIIHLAGESVMGYWTPGKKERILSSRIDTTRQIVEAIEQTPDRLRIFLCASGAGIYGERNDEILDESAPPGQGCLVDVSVAWEAEAAKAAAYGIRVASLRTGLVLGKNQGAFPLLRRVFSLCLGGKLGTGHQYMPWIHIDDIVALYLFCLENSVMQGAVNAAAPETCTNDEFTRTLAAEVHRPAIFGTPEFVLKTALGGQAGLVLESQRVVPTKALAAGFTFAFPTLKSALSNLLAPVAV